MLLTYIQFSENLRDCFQSVTKIVNTYLTLVLKRRPMT